MASIGFALQKRLFLLLMMLLAAFGGMNPARAVVPDAAVVIAASGDTSMLRSGRSITPLKRGDAVREGDRVLTGRDGRVQMRFADGAVVSLQPGSHFSVDRFRYDHQEQKSLLSLARGALRTVSGAIGKRQPDDYRMSTPTATVGIRGTEYELVQGACTDSGCRPGEEPGLQVAVIRGRVAVGNNTGTVEVDAGAVLKVNSRDAIPVFVRGAPRVTRAAQTPSVASLPAQAPVMAAPAAGSAATASPAAAAVPRGHRRHHANWWF